MIKGEIEECWEKATSTPEESQMKEIERDVLKRGVSACNRRCRDTVISKIMSMVWRYASNRFGKGF